MTRAELGVWAESHAPAGSAVAVVVLKLLEEVACKDTLLLSLAERIVAQSHLLSRKAEKGCKVRFNSDGPPAVWGPDGIPLPPVEQA